MQQIFLTEKGILLSTNSVRDTSLFLSGGILLPSNNKNPDSKWQTIRKMYYWCNRKSWFMMDVRGDWFIGARMWSTAPVLFISGLCHRKHVLCLRWMQHFQPSNPERIIGGSKVITPSSSCLNKYKIQKFTEAAEYTSCTPCLIDEILAAKLYLS